MLYRNALFVLLAMATLLAPASPGLAVDVERRFETYAEFHAAVLELWVGEKPDDAIRLFRTGLELFPDRSFEITFSLINMNLSIARVEDCFELFEFGHTRGFYFPIYTKSGPFAAHLETPRFQTIVQRNRTLIAEAEKSTQKQLRVIAPTPIDAGSSYPLLIVLHGWSGKLDTIEKTWEPVGKGDSIIVAYLQSSQIVGMGMFGWDDLERARRDIKETFEQLVSEYPVDPDKTVIAGFSQGGRTAIDMAVNNVIPAAGFVAHCPGGGLTESVSLDDVQSAAGRGLRGTILTGKIDHSRDEQEQLVAILEQGSLDYRYVTIPDLGHWYPNDFASHLDAAIAHIWASSVPPE